MSADNRTPHTDALATLGMIHTRTEGRDAIHLGVEQVVAGERLERGEPIGFGSDGKAYQSWFGCEGDNSTPKCVGIVDPFLDETIYKGQKFWLIVLPRQITSLRHVWEHPDFKPSGEVPQAEGPTAEQLLRTRALIGDEEAKAQLHMQSVADNLGVDKDELIEHAREHKDNGDYWVDGGRFEGENIGDPTAFWNAYEKITGETVDSGHRNNFLSCTC